MLNKFTRYKKRSDQTPLTFSVSLNEELCEDNSEYFIEGEGSILDQSQITSELDGSRGAHSRWNQTGNSSRLESETPRSFGWIKRPDLRLDVTCSTYDFFTPPLPPRSKAQKMQILLPKYTIIGMRIAIAVVIISFALTLPYFTYLMGLTGNITGLILAFLLPCYFHIKGGGKYDLWALFIAQDILTRSDQRKLPLSLLSD